MHKTTVFVALSVIGLLAVSLDASGQNYTIPSWIKNNAKWWSEGTITESDYVQSLQYLVSQGIIKLPLQPVQQVVATKSSVSDNDRAMSMVVHIKTSKDEKYYTFSALYQFSQTIGQANTGQTNIPTGLGGVQFQLSSLPSKDKKAFYELVSRFINPGAKPDPFDVHIDLLAGDGSLIETLQYDKCEVSSYWADTNTNKEQYRFSTTADIEFEDHANFVCSGYHLKLP